MMTKGFLQQYTIQTLSKMHETNILHLSIMLNKK